MARNDLSVEALDKAGFYPECVGIREAFDQEMIGASTRILADRTKCPCYRSLLAVCYIDGNVDSGRRASIRGSKRRSRKMISEPLTFHGGDADIARRQD